MSETKEVFEAKKKLEEQEPTAEAVVALGKLLLAAEEEIGLNAASELLPKYLRKRMQLLLSAATGGKAEIEAALEPFVLDWHKKAINSAWKELREVKLERQLIQLARTLQEIDGRIGRQKLVSITPKRLLQQRKLDTLLTVASGLESAEEALEKVVSEPRPLRLQVRPIRVGLERPEHPKKIKNETAEEAKARVGAACEKLRAYLRKYRFSLRQAMNVMYWAQARTEKWNEEKGVPRVGSVEEVKAELRKMTGDPVSIVRNIDRYVRTMLPRINANCLQMASARMYVAWTSKMPETGIPRNLAVMDAAARMPWFANEPLHFKCFKSLNSDVKFDGHRIFVRFDHDLKWVELKIINTKHKRTYNEKPPPKGKRNGGKKSLDYMYWYVLKNLQKGEYSPAGARLQMKDGKFSFSCCYNSERGRPELNDGKKRPFRKVSYDRVADASFTEERTSFIKLSLREGHEPSAGIPVDQVREYPISAEAAIAAIDRLDAQQRKAENRIAATGSSNKRRKAEQKRRKRITEHRENVINQYCHDWSRQLADWCSVMGCGRMMVFDVPDLLFGRSFQWAKLRFHLQSKCRERGIEASFHESPKDSTGDTSRSGDPQAEVSAPCSVGLDE